MALFPRPTGDPADPADAVDMCDTYDIAVCGGGLAGATLARQVKLRHPGATVLVVDSQAYPVPVAAFKVGESTVDIAGFYFAELLGLRDYMAQRHLPKLGLRYFFGAPDRALWEAPEVGLSRFSRCPTYQIDRGVLENDLYEMNVAAGVEIATGARVLDIELAPGAEPHRVAFRDCDGNERTVRCRWVVDAMGRLRFLQRKLGLQRETDGMFNAAWFRVRGRLDIEDFVPDTQVEWHARVPGRVRYFSTNHLMGPGYWVWLIPLGSGNTSVGIVSSGALQAIGEMDTLERAIDWLARHEPAVAAGVARHEIMDFVVARDFSYTSSLAISADRWACVGEAAAFADPFYSPGSNMIAFENTAVVTLLGEDAAGAFDETRAAELNSFVLAQNDWVEYNIHSSYSYFGEPLIMTVSFIWDTLLAWTTATPQIYNGIYLDAAKSAAVRAETTNLYPLALRVKRLFKQWEGRARRGRRFVFVDYASIPFLQEAYERNLVAGKTIDELVADHRITMAVVEEVALAIFLIAVDDTMPARRRTLDAAPWLNAWAIGLDPELWAHDGLFAPTTPPRDVSGVLGQLERLFEPDAVDAVGAATIDLDL
ncbi:Halogenase [Frankia canadensis]|uniref:Halogenase n=1 Tax=Frankia canadensis TaxID=1836972 RepID=A0A2I2KI83_9ACTN|nr:FAD-dependent monooxygenase [Frankia canadensis]SNQ45377.1 Halogenase [Frankia canadensis]SOU52667.1 Halogenase [Frankia canadensis]